MIFESFLDPHLGQVSYIVACNKTKDAFIVDPRRDIDKYKKFIEKNSLNLKYILNTHTHADYIGGHLELALKYKAENIFQNRVPITNFKILRVKDKDILSVGETLELKILETPGHTPFDISCLVKENDVEKMLFTGDFLFVGDIGRPDLLGEQNIHQLIDNSYKSAIKIWNLADDIMVFSSHIEGSFCGKNLSKQYFSTIGIEKKTNYSFSLSQKSQNSYIENLLSQKIETPLFFKKMATININGPKLIDNIFNDIKKVNFEEIKSKKDIQIVDLREPKKFHKKHIKNSINIYEFSNVSLIAGNLLDYEKDIYLIGEVNSKIKDFNIKLLRVGIDNIKGIINSDIASINNCHLNSSNIILKKDITDEFTNILLDENCSQLGKVIDVSISKIKNTNLSKYDKLVFSCNYGFKASAVVSCLNLKNIYYWNE